MADHLITVSSDRLETGLYVAELDRSWLQTPFPSSGIYLTNAAQVESLRRYCRYVYVDPARSDPDAAAALRRPASATGSAAGSEFEAARTTLHNVVSRIAAAVRGARQHGRIDIAQTARAGEMLVEAALRSPDACLWRLRLNGGSGLLYRRSLGTALHAILFGRQLGLDQTELRHLATGGLLLDIGKTAVPVPLLAKPTSLNRHEREFVHRHVQQGFSILRLSEGAPDRVIEMVLGHHERLDGSGYPRRLTGTSIPLFARMAAIVDSFDALTLNRHYADAVSAHEALRILNSQRDRGYDGALVGEFIHALGVYPTGTRVQLTDGSTGVVCAQDPDWPLRPRILVTTGADGNPLADPRLLANGLDGHVARALPPAGTPADLAFLERAVIAQS